MNAETSASFESPRASVLGEASVLAAGQLLCVIAALASTRLLTGMAPPQVFGAFSLLTGVLMLLRSSALTPLGQTVNRFYADTEISGTTWRLKRVLRRWQRWMIAALASGGACVALAAWSLASVPLLVSAAFTGLICLFVIRDIEFSWLNASRRHMTYSLWTAADAWVKPLAIVGMIYLAGASLSSMMTGFLLATAVVMPFFLRASGRGEMPPTDREASRDASDDRLARKMLRYALPVIPAPLLGWIAGMGDRYAICWILDLNHVGLYAAVYSLTSQPFLMLERVTSLTFRPRFFKATASENEAERRKVLLIWTATYLGIGTVGVVAISLTSDTLVSFLLAENYRSGAPLMMWLAGGNLLLGASRIIESQLHAYKKTHYILLGRTAGAICVVTVTLSMVWQWDLLGAAIACPIYFALQCLVLACLSYHASRQPYRIAAIQDADNDLATRRRAA